MIENRINIREYGRIEAIVKGRDATLFPVWLFTGYCQEKTSMMSPEFGVPQFPGIPFSTIVFIIL
jgi:hypothetical protein